LDFKRDWFLYSALESSNQNESQYESEYLNESLEESFNLNNSSSSSCSLSSKDSSLKRKYDEQTHHEVFEKELNELNRPSKVLKVDENEEESVFLNCDEKNLYLDIEEMFKINDIKESLEKEVSCFKSYHKCNDLVQQDYLQHTFYDEYVNESSSMNNYQSNHLGYSAYNFDNNNFKFQFDSEYQYDTLNDNNLQEFGQFELEHVELF
jgi:hypothetical protein